MTQRLHYGALAGIIILTLSGCASRAYVDQSVQDQLVTIRTEMDTVQKDVKQNQDGIAQLKTEAMEQKERMDKEHELVQEALDRAEEAKSLASGKLLYQVTMSDESVPFAFQDAELSEDAKAVLDSFATELIDANKGVYIEIQGHTDDRGSKGFNYRLGLSRAESARRYLHDTHMIPLHRMNAYSYGETQPLGSNKTAEGRAQNRRVVFLVME